MKKLLILVVAIATFCLAICQETWVPTNDWYRTARPNQRPIKGYITKKETAIVIGRAVITEMFGKAFEEDMEPLNAKLFDDVWVVYSHFTVRDKNGKRRLGGPTTVEICRTSGAILNVTSER